MAATIGFIGFAWLAVFQALLAAGAPLGHMAWGGADRVLPPPRRWASVAVLPIPAVGIWAMAGALGLVSPRAPAYLLWGLAGLFAVSFVLNLLSQSVPERIHGTILTAILVLCCLIVVRGG